MLIAVLAAVLALGVALPGSSRAASLSGPAYFSTGFGGRSRVRAVLRSGPIAMAGAGPAARLDRRSRRCRLGRGSAVRPATRVSSFQSGGPKLPLELARRNGSDRHG